MVASPHHSEPAWRCAKFLGACRVDDLFGFLELTAADDPRFIARFWAKPGKTMLSAS